MSNVGQQMLSGGLSGLASTIFLQPFDLLKTRVQQRDGLLEVRQRPNLLKITRNVVATDGVAGLWRGTVPSLFRNVPGVALYMTSLTQIRTLMATSQYFSVFSSSATKSKTGSVLPKLSSHGNLLAGAMTRVAVGFVLNPFSVLKARFESDIYRTQYNSFPSALVSIVRSGRSELFKGFVPSAIRDAPYAGVFVAVYESIKRQTSNLTHSTSMMSSAGLHIFSAASAGAIATLITHPFDVIKTKVQVRQEDRYQGLRRTARTVWEQRGVSGFFDGVALRVSRKILSSAIGWAVYEGMLMLMHENNRSRGK